MQNESKKRNPTIDILRAFGILLIVLAHTSLKNYNNGFLFVLFNARSFDVPLLIFVSGMSFSISNSEFYFDNNSYFKYALKRFKRIVLPSLIFVAIFLIYYLIIQNFLAIDRLTVKYSLLSFSSFGGVGYIWICRVIFLLAILSPFFKFVISKIKNKIFVIVFIMVLYICNSVACYFFGGIDNVFIKILIVDTLLFTIGLSVPYLVGMIWCDLSLLLKAFVFSFFVSSFVAEMIIFRTFDLQLFKYPPYALFLSFGLIISCSLYEIINYFMKSRPLYSWVSWLSKNSFNIYFVHIFFVFTFDSANILNDFWWLQYLIYISCSVLIVFLYLLLKKKNQERKKAICESDKG